VGKNLFIVEQKVVGFADRDFATVVVTVPQSLRMDNMVGKWNLGPCISAAGND